MQRVAVLALLLTPIAALADDAKPITVELSAFKQPAEKAELFGHNEGEGKLFLYTNGTMTAPVKIPADGTYTITIKASCQKAQNTFANFKLSIDGKEVGKETALTSEDEKAYTLEAELKAGEVKLGISFTNDKYKEGEYDSNLFIHGVSLKKK